MKPNPSVTAEVPSGSSTTGSRTRDSLPGRRTSKYAVTVPMRRASPTVTPANNRLSKMARPGGTKKIEFVRLTNNDL